MSIRSIENLIDTVKKAGALACQGQDRMTFANRFVKADGSIVTEYDRKVEDYLFTAISKLYPGVNILTEETARDFDEERPYTFAVDPIDGTDVFSQGMPNWCLSVGLLDREKIPVAGIIYAPRWKSLFFADIGKAALHNGQEIMPVDSAWLFDSRTNLMVTSTIGRHVDVSKFPGKCRNVGSIALQLCFPLIYGAVAGTVTGKTFIWDIAAGHAINRSLGLTLEYLGGGEVTYEQMTDGSPSTDYILSGTVQVIRQLRACLKRRL